MTEAQISALVDAIKKVKAGDEIANAAIALAIAEGEITWEDLREALRRLREDERRQHDAG